MVIHRKALVGVPKIQRQRRRPLPARQCRLRQIRPPKSVVNEPYPHQFGIRRLHIRKRIAQLPRKQRPVIPPSNRIPLRQARYRPIQAIAEKYQVISPRQCMRDSRRLIEPVVLIQRQLFMYESMIKRRQRLLPMLFHDIRPVRRAIVQPLRRPNRRMRLPIHPVHIRQRIKPRGNHHHRDRRPHRQTQPRLARRRPIPQRQQHPRPEQRQQRRYRQQVPHKFHMKRARYQKERRYPAQQQHRRPRLLRPHRQRRNQRRQREPRRHRHRRDVLRNQQYPRRQRPPRQQIRQSRPQRHPAQRHIQQPAPRRYP